VEDGLCDGEGVSLVLFWLYMYMYMLQGLIQWYVQ
jgi:hypothetical protein